MQTGRGDRAAGLRRHYTRAGLAEVDLAPDPVAQFDDWFSDAVTAGLTEPNAVVLATASPDGQPSARTVLLKGYDARGFVVYTNLDSRKGREARANPRASLVFPWIDLERQVVVVGAVELVDAQEVAAYFASRPHGSQLGAHASRQSTVIGSRDALERRRAELERRWPAGSDVPVPPDWGGLRIVPVSVEFWQGRADRLHDRLRYRRCDSGWTVERLSP